MESLQYIINPSNKNKIKLNTSEAKNILTKYINRYNFKKHIKKIPITKDIKYV